jgi:hypothetical protein
LIITRTRTTKMLLCTALGCGLAGCGGGEVGGTVTGLGTGLSVTLLNNGSDSLTVARNGSFAFADTLGADDAYAVTVKTQPVGQTCTVANGSGKLDADGNSIDDVEVSCAYLASLRGTVAGLLVGTAVTLGNGDARLVVAGNGPFAFAETLEEGSVYSVAVITQPLGTSCTVENGTGTFAASTFRDIVVNCN